MKARLRREVDVEQWDGSVDEALRLGLIEMRVINVPSLVAWHLATDHGPVRLGAGDWIVTHPGGCREAVARAVFSTLYEVR